MAYPSLSILFEERKFIMGMDLEFYIEKYNSENRTWEFIDAESYGRNSELYDILKQLGYTARKLPNDLSNLIKSKIDKDIYYSYGWFSIYDFKTRLAEMKTITRTGYLTPEQYYDLLQHDKIPTMWTSTFTELTPINVSWESTDLHCINLLNEMIDAVAKRNDVKDMLAWSLLSRLVYILE